MSRKIGFKLLVIGVTAVSAIGLAACSSSTNKASSSAASSASNSAKVPTGEPITIGMSVFLNTPYGNLNSLVSAAKAGVLGLNSRGGIAGRPVKLDVCNNAFDPTQSEKCAKQFVSEGAIATVGDVYPVGGPAANTILAAANISQVFSLPLSTQEWNAQNSMTINGSAEFDAAAAAAYAGTVLHAKKLYVQDVAGAGDNFKNLVTTVAKNTGMTIVGYSQLPNTVADYSPYAQQIISSGADATVFDLQAGQDTQLWPVLQRAGYTGYLVASQNSFTPDVRKQISQSVWNKFYGATPVPPVSAASSYPALNTMLADMKAEAATGDKDAPDEDPNQLEIQNWLAVQAIAQVAATLPSISAKALEDGFNSHTTTPINVQGIVQITPGAPGVLPGFSRVNNFKEYMTIWKGHYLLAPTVPSFNVLQYMQPS